MFEEQFCDMVVVDCSSPLIVAVDCSHLHR